MPAFKPLRHTSVSPYLSVTDAEATLAFLEAVFSARRLREERFEDGLVMHAEVRIDDTVVMLTHGTPQFPAVAAHVHVYVPAVDTTHAAALAAGGTSVRAPAEEGDGDRRGAVLGPGGVTWWISTQTG